MTPCFEQDGVTLYHGDMRGVLAQLPAESVSCVVTSPPFYGLRKYEHEPQIWGGEPECTHRLETSDGREPSVGNRRQLPHGDGRKNDPYADERVPHPVSAEGGYAGRKRWQQETLL